MGQTIYAKDLKEKKNDFVITDVREPDEIVGRQIEGSTNIPLGLVIRNARQGKLDHLKDKRIVFHRPAGYRGNIATDELNKAGFQALNLEGGFGAWKKMPENTS
jgi:rhodanese-related sulfurtransferase